MLWTSKDFITENFEPNYVYKVQVEINGEMQEWKFYTKFTPYYSTRRQVKSDYRNSLKGAPDPHIDVLIYENSKYAYEIASEEIKSQIDKGTIPTVVERYVRVKTQVDLIQDLLIANSMQAGMSEKMLGDFKITYEIKTPDLESILPLLEDKLMKLEQALGGVSVARSAVRAGSNPYPYAGRASFRGAGE